MMHNIRTVARWAALGAMVFSAAACRRGSSSGSARAPVPEASQAGSEISSGGDLVTAMRLRYAGKWYRTLSFTQTNTYTLTGREQTSKWQESLSLPGKLRIDFLPAAQRSGVLIDNSRVITFDNGRRVDSRRAVQPRILLTGDVYHLPPAVTLRRLDSLGVKLDRFHVGRIGGRRMYVVGAEDRDITSTQFWVDAESLLLTRVIQREQRGTTPVITDVRVTSYREIDGYQVPEGFVSSRAGKQFLKEQYSNVRVNVPMPESLFDPARWTTARKP